MSASTRNDVPLACITGAIPASERQSHFALIQSLFTEDLLTRNRTESGYDFHFPAAALERVARFVDNERKCCPFLNFVIEAEAGGGPVRLRMTGPAGTPLFLEHELPISQRDS